MITAKPDFASVYEKYFSSIYNYVYAQLLHKERTEDLVSEVFVKAMAHYGEYDPNKSQVQTWLTRIARNTLIDSYRKHDRTEILSLDEEGADEPFFEEEYKILDEPVYQEVHKLLRKLTESERELLTMIYFQDMKNPEIAEVLGINPKAVSERHRRLLEKCRRLERGTDIRSILE